MPYIDYSELNFGDNVLTSRRRVTISRAALSGFDGIRILTKEDEKYSAAHYQYLTESELDELIVHLVSAKLRLSE